VSKIPLAGLLFLIFNPIVSQFNKAAFEKNYLEFHEKWEAGYDCSLKKIDAQSKVIEQLILRLDALEKKE
jgi:hypothetical protein